MGMLMWVWVCGCGCKCGCDIHVLFAVAWVEVMVLNAVLVIDHRCLEFVVLHCRRDRHVCDKERGWVRGRGRM